MGMISLKTAVLIAASAKIGALIAGAPDKMAKALYDYAFELGLAFQIKDDYLDTYGDPLTFGKKIGGDILTGKKSWLLVESIRRANNEERSELIELAKESENLSMTPDEKIEKVTNLYNKLEVKEAAEEEMVRLQEKALHHLEGAGFSEQQIERLEEFAEELINRTK